MLLVDTYNVLHVTGVLPPEIAGPDTVALARLISQSRYRARETYLVCDGVRGSRGRERFEHVHIVYAGGARGGAPGGAAGSRPHDADGWIERRLARTTPPSTVVVSNDRRVQRAARGARRKWMTSETFLEHLAEDVRLGLAAPERNVLRDSIPLRNGAVARWMDLFGLDDASIRSLFDALGATAEVEPESVESPAREIPKPCPVDPPSPPRGGREAERDPKLRRLLDDASVDPDDLDMSKWL